MNGWFCALGAPISPEEQRLVAEYLRGLGILDELSVAGIADWKDARSIITDPAWDRRWWDAERAERQRLHARAVAAHGGTAVLRLLSRTLEASELVEDAASTALARSGCADRGIVGSAAGAASDALALAELARIAEQTDAHPFRVKHALFAAGRWPLGISSGRYWMF